MRVRGRALERAGISLEHERGGANGRAGPGPSAVEKARQ